MSAQRDAPCPCGSGKKYKNCCLRREQREAARADHRGAVERAIAWLDVRYPRALQAAIEHGFLAGLDDEQHARLRELPSDFLMMVQINSLDWLLAEGEIEIARGGTTERLRASDLILGLGGPLLMAPQRAFLENLVKSPLRIYEVLESRAGESLLLRDFFEPGRGDVTVQERSGSGQLVQWEVFGARIVRVQDHWELSGSVYSFGESARELARDLAESIMKLGPETGGDSTHSQRLLSQAIVASWLTVLTTRRPPPVLVDQGSGDPLMLVTDHHEVLDWNDLARRLEAEPDVEGDRREGWTRFVELGDDMRRSLLAINIGKAKDRIEPFARTVMLADSGRAWLDRVAGNSIRFLIRDVVDPMSMIGQEDQLKSKARRTRAASVPGSPEELTRFHQQFAEKHYRRWADEKIPALGDLSLREAVTAAGREAVVDLVKGYEALAFRQARGEKSRSVDFEFLWAQVGLDRSRELAPR